VAEAEWAGERDAAEADAAPSTPAAAAAAVGEGELIIDVFVCEVGKVGSKKPLQEHGTTAERRASKGSG
jgi:hypothetical protein